MRKMKYIYLVAVIFTLGCQGTSPDENEEVQLQHFEFTPYDGPPIRPNDRALEDVDSSKKEKK